MKSESNKQENVSAKSKKVIKKTIQSSNVDISKFKDIEGKFLHIKVGESAHPATVEQISEIQDKIVSLLEKNNINSLVFVTHHAVSIDIIEKVN